MSQNYAQALAQDKKGIDLQEFPAPFKANARYGTNNATASSVITLNDNTTTIEVSAVGQAVAVRWVPSTESASTSPFASVTTTGASANFDHIVPANYYRRFVVPVETIGVNSVVGIGVQAGTYRRVAIISAATVSSVLLSEF